MWTPIVLCVIAFLLLVIAGALLGVYGALRSQTRQLASLGEVLSVAVTRILAAVAEINAQRPTQREDDLERVRDLLAQGKKTEAVAYWTDTKACSLGNAYDVVLKVEHEL